MRRSVRPVLLLLSCLAMPASAQFAPRLPTTSGWIPSNPLDVESRPEGPGIARDLQDVRERIERGRDGGDLTRGEARGLRREARRIDQVARRYGENGLSGSERSHLEGLTLALRDQVGRPRPRPVKVAKR